MRMRILSSFLVLLLMSFSLMLTEIVFAQGGCSGTSCLDCSNTSVGFIPLNKMSANQFYFGEEGGLYGGGNNNPPAAHMNQAFSVASQIIPRNSSGISDPINGKIVLLSLGMSNTTQEYIQFITDAASIKNDSVVLIDGAFGSQTAAKWANPLDETPWANAEGRLTLGGVTPSQVQAMWLKITNFAPAQGGGGQLTGFAQDLRDDIAIIVKKAKTKYPNLKIIYLSSRIYAGYTTYGLNPEPYAYESAFADRWVIEDQINGGGVTGTTYNNAPVLLWGPYIWADGLISNDGLIWKCSTDLESQNMDFQNDGTHPSLYGEMKVSQKLIEFFTTHPTTTWFAGSNGPLPTPTPVGSASPQPTPNPSGLPSGDVNGDGQVNLQDIQLVVMSFGKVEPPILAADVNNDGKVNIFDYAIVVADFLN